MSPCPHRPRADAPPTAALPKLEQLYSPEEAAMLQVVRHVFAAYGPARLPGLRMPPEAARDLPGGAGTFGILADCVHAMRLARRSTFWFSNPLCRACAGRVTPHERQFMAALRHARRGDPDLAGRHATLLCEANDCGPFLARLACLPQESSGRVPTRPSAN